MKKIYSPVLIAIALLSTLLLFTSCEEETPSVGSPVIEGRWECTQAPSNNNAFFIKGDFIEFNGRTESFGLVRPDGKRMIGTYKLNDGKLTLKPDGSEEISFIVTKLDSSVLYLQNGGFISFSRHN